MNSQEQWIVDERFRAVADRFAEYLAESGYSAQLAVRWHGEVVLDCSGGPEARPDSLTGVYSVSKAVAALVIATLIDDGRLDPDQTVAHYWPEFAARGKDSVTVRQLLSHQAGLPALTGAGRRPLEDVLDSSIAAAQLAGQLPLWRPGSAWGYHALTIGVLMEELVRRITGEDLQTIFERDIRSPRDADFFLGLPSWADDRYVQLRDAELTAEQFAEASAAPPRDPLGELVLSNLDVPAGQGPDGVSSNNPRVRAAGPAALGGVGSANGLARLFADALPNSQQPIARPETFELMTQQHSWGVDRIGDIRNLVGHSFGLVFMLPSPRLPYASVGAFGHDGAGGALAFADPATSISFGYIPLPMQYPGGADHRSLVLARLVRECALSA